MNNAHQIALQESRPIVEAEEHRFTALVRSYSQLLFRIAFALTRNVEDAEDVVQDTFLKIYRTKAWLSMTDEKAFLARATWRVALDKISRKRKDRAFQPMIQAATGPDMDLLQQDSHAQVHRLIDTLPEDLRQPLVLATVEELSSREIGEMLGIPEGTVRTRLMRGREMLKEKLGALGRRSL